MHWGKASEVTFHRQDREDPVGRSLKPNEAAIAADEAAIYGTEDELAELGAKLREEFGPWRRPFDTSRFLTHVRPLGVHRRAAMIKKAEGDVVAAARKLFSKEGPRPHELINAVLALERLSEVDGGGDHEGESGGDKGERIAAAVGGEREDGGDHEADEGKQREHEDESFFPELLELQREAANPVNNAFNLGQRRGAVLALKEAEERIMATWGRTSTATIADVLEILRDLRS